MVPLPAFLSLAFGLTTVLTVGLFYRAARYARRTLGVLVAVLLAQGGLALRGFYMGTSKWPPRLPLLLGPGLLVLLALLLTSPGRRYLDGLRLASLTLLHVVRLPVELVLFGLFLHRAVPQLITFEGYNWDIIMGLSAPITYYLVQAKMLGSKWLLCWNSCGLILLLNVVVTAVLAALSPLQRFAFEQPNVAILCFPFVWLPAGIVPMVVVAHVAAIRQLWRLPANQPLVAA